MTCTLPPPLRSVTAPPAPTRTVTAAAVVRPGPVLSTDELRGARPAGKTATEVVRVAAVVVRLSVTAVTSDGSPDGRMVMVPPAASGARGAPSPLRVSTKRRAATGV